jgi:hypothetical protein
VYVSGLTGSGLQVTLNGGAPISISANSQTTLARLTNGAAYAVAINAQPSNPAQTCSAVNSSGKISGNNVDITINCVLAVQTSPNSTTIAADLAIPSSVTSTITTVLTGDGSGSLGGSVPVSMGISGDTLAMALNAQGQTVLASMVSTDTTTFSADSTALALVRMTLGDVAVTNALSAAQLNAAVRASADYPALVSIISADLTAGTRPLSDPLVGQGVLNIANEALSAFPAGTLKSHRAQIQALNSPPVTTLPKVLVTNGPSPELQIASSSKGAIVVDNNLQFALTIDISIASATGADSPYSSTPLPPETSTSAPMNNGPFNVFISQSPSDQIDTITDLGANWFEQAIGTISPTGCATNTLKTAITAGIKPALQSGQSIGMIAKTFASGITKDNAYNVLKACGTQIVIKLGPAAAALVVAVAAADAEVIAAGLAVKGIFDGVGYAVKVAEVEGYWGKTWSIGVCAGSDGSVGSCVASFVFNPTTLLMAPGAITTITIGGLDNSNPPKPTVVPATLLATPVDPTIATATGSSMMQVSALAVGNTDINVTDPTSGITDMLVNGVATPLHVTVSKPLLSPSPSSFVVTQTN